MECTIRTLKTLQRKGLPLEIYYAEEMPDGEIEWSVDILNNPIDNICETAWAFSVISKAEDDAYREQYNDDSPIAEYEIVIDEPFSDAVVCKAIKIWLEDNGIKLDVMMIDFDDIDIYSGYVKELMNRDIDDEINHAVPLE